MDDDEWWHKFQFVSSLFSFKLNLIFHVDVGDDVAISVIEQSLFFIFKFKYFLMMSWDDEVYVKMGMVIML